MSQFKTKVLTTAVALSLVFYAGSAFAGAGEATDTTNIHAAPSGSSQVVDQLYAGEPVDIRTCRGNWCYITHPGPDGWVSVRAIEQTSYGYDAPDPGFGGGIVVINPGHHRPYPPVIVDPGPKHPIYPIVGVGPVLGKLPIYPNRPITGTGAGPITGTGPGNGAGTCAVDPSLPKCHGHGIKPF
ncbi:MAG: SH3 domain-containing protein [Devosia sp.]